MKKLKIGDQYEGGIVFYINPDGKSGLIVSSRDMGRHSLDEAKELCAVCNEGGYNDWSLPTIEELILLWKQRYFIDIFMFRHYLSDTIDTNMLVGTVFAYNGSVGWYDKKQSFYMKVIRRFVVEQEIILLGLDLSTVAVGWSILRYNKYTKEEIYICNEKILVKKHTIRKRNLVDILEIEKIEEQIQLENTNCKIETLKLINNLKSQYNFDYIIIEDVFYLADISAVKKLCRIHGIVEGIFLDSKTKLSYVIPAQTKAVIGVNIKSKEYKMLKAKDKKCLVRDKVRTLLNDNNIGEHGADAYCALATFWNKIKNDIDYK